jgi:hypothetical protein
MEIELHNYVIYSLSALSKIKQSGNISENTLMRFHFCSLPCLLLSIHCGPYHNVKTVHCKILTIEEYVLSVIDLKRKICMDHVNELNV